MKKIYLWSLFSISISILVFSCRKDYKNFFNQKDDVISSDLEAAKIFHAKGAYLNKTTYAELMVQGSKSVLSTEKIAKKLFFIKLSPLWKDAFEVKAYDGSDLIVVPTPENRLSDKTFEIRRFFIFTKKGGSVVDGKIVEFLGLNYPLKDKMNDLIANYKNSKVLDLTGAIFEYDLNYFRLSAEVIKQGKRTGLTASFHYLPIAQTNVNGKVAMGYYDTGAPDANGCSTLSYCEGYYSNGEAGVNCNNLGYSTSNCNPSNPNPTGTSDSGYDSSGAYQSGGGSYAGNPPPPPSLEDPCAKGKILSDNTTFKQNMTNLNTGLNENHESAYKLNKDGTVDYQNGGAGGLNYNFPASYFENSVGFIHNHENNAGNLAIFSADDFRAMFIAVSAASAGDKAAYTFAVVTSAGSYLLSINNLAQFTTFKDNNFSPNNPNQFNGFKYLYNNYVKTSNTPAQNEVGLVQLMQSMTGGAGLTLMKSSGSTTPVWNKVTNENNAPVYVNCP